MRKLLVFIFFILFYTFVFSADEKLNIAIISHYKNDTKDKIIKNIDKSFEILFNDLQNSLLIDYCFYSRNNDEKNISIDSLEILEIKNRSKINTLIKQEIEFDSKQSKYIVSYSIYQYPSLFKAKTNKIYLSGLYIDSIVNNKNKISKQFHLSILRDLFEYSRFLQIKAMEKVDQYVSYFGNFYDDRKEMYEKTKDKNSNSRGPGRTVFKIPGNEELALLNFDINEFYKLFYFEDFPSDIKSWNIKDIKYNDSLFIHFEIPTQLQCQITPIFLILKSYINSPNFSDLNIKVFALPVDCICPNFISLSTNEITLKTIEYGFFKKEDLLQSNLCFYSHQEVIAVKK